MIIDQLPLLGGDVQATDEIPIERGTTTYKTTPDKFLGAMQTDATPTLGSTNPVQSGGVYSSIQTVNNSIVRPNLLRNAYFVGGGSQLGDGIFPVNQRGQQSYSNNAYTIDGWILTKGTVNVKSDCVQFVSNSDAAYKRFRLRLGAPLVAGQTYTLSLLCKKNSGAAYIRLLYGSTSVMPGGSKEIPANSGVQLVTNTVTVPTGQDYENGVEILVMNASSNTADVDMYAWKLELGDTQTLAHQENGAWVLNEIPDFGAELAKCQRYLLKVLGNAVRYPNTQLTTGLIDFTVPTPVTMAATGTGVSIESGTFVIYGIGSDGRMPGTTETGFAFEVNYAGTNAVCIRASKASHGLERALLGISGYVLLTCEP